MTDVIRIHDADTEEEAKARYTRIITRLEELGINEVRFMKMSGGLPTQWDPIIRAWLKDKEEGYGSRPRSDAAQEEH